MVTPFRVAVRVSVPAAAVELTVAEKVALWAPAATATELGTAMAACELVIATLDPPARAGPLKLTVQETDPGAVTDAGAQEMPVNVAEAGAAALTSIKVDVFFPYATAVRVTAPADAPEDTLRVKPALSVFPRTVTEAGNDTAELLLESCTPTPPPGAGALNAIVHASEPGAVSADWLHDSASGTGVPEAFNWAPQPFRPVRADVRRSPELSRRITAHILDRAAMNFLPNGGKR